MASNNIIMQQEEDVVVKGARFYLIKNISKF